MMKCLPLMVLLATINCTAQTSNKRTGTIDRYDSSINAILSPAAHAEIIATGFDWSEGPLWIEKSKMLLFSDVPRNTIYKWTEKGGAEIYLHPSGYTDTAKRGGETGSNGLTVDNQGALVLCQHGDRRLARMEAPINKPSPKFVSLATTYLGKKFNSPNDAVYTSNSELFFTDPAYGMEKDMNDPKKELPFQGVYKVKRSGEVVLITDTLTRPNGIAFFPGERRFLVANSDGRKPIWYAYDINAAGDVCNGRIFYNATGYDRSLKGGNDGLKIDKAGNVFATGPGGLWI
ncbi:MAG TPA: SMP-30/gluconolactonase/LRE family protein, partial [Flavisolibacter sp.]|nr:SMP-30/gluconolactonase/LRE family protein [Flavisolibacter sp.]